MLNNKEVEPEALSFAAMKELMVSREKNSHKGNFGHSLLVGGDFGYIGAVRLAAEAALRSGSGLVSVATRPDHAAAVAISRPELMCRGVSSCLDLSPLLKQCNVIGIGPGLGQSRWSQQLLESSLSSKHAIVLDADGLNLLAKKPIKRNNWILTPHVGEAARLLNCAVVDIQNDRLAAVKQLQQQYGGVVVLKGSGTLVCSATGDVFICQAGNPGMASGGMGDVLTGVITGLVAQGIGLLDAVKLGVLIHATAGDRASKNGEKGMLASDLMPYIRELVNEN